MKETSILIRVFHQPSRVSSAKMIKRYRQFLERLIYWHAKTTSDSTSLDTHKSKKDPKTILDNQASPALLTN